MEEGAAWHTLTNITWDISLCIYSSCLPHFRCCPLDRNPASWCYVIAVIRHNTWHAKVSNLRKWEWEQINGLLTTGKPCDMTLSRNTYLASAVTVQQDIPCSEISVDKSFLGEVDHTCNYLTAEFQELSGRHCLLCAVGNLCCTNTSTIITAFKSSACVYTYETGILTLHTWQLTLTSQNCPSPLTGKIWDRLHLGAPWSSLSKGIYNSNFT